MAKTLQFRRGTTSELSSVTGAVGELFVDTTKDTVVVMDGSTAGGFPLQRELTAGSGIDITGNTISATGGGSYGNAEVAAYLSNVNSITIGNTTMFGDGYGQPKLILNASNLTSTLYASNAVILSSLSGNIYIPSGNLTTTGIKTDNYYYANGSPVSFGGGSYGNIDVANYLSSTSVRNFTLGDSNFGFGKLILGFNSGTGSATAELTACNAVILSSLSGNIYIPSGNLTTTGIKTDNYYYANGAPVSFGGGGSGADLSQVAEDILPLFSEVYDLGSSTKRWYDAYLSNTLNINDVTLTGSAGALTTTADVVVGSLLADQILITENMIVPDASTATEYSGGQGVVIVDGNMDIQGDWLKVAVVQSANVTTTVSLPAAWTSGGSLAIARFGLAGAGSQSAGLAFGGFDNNSQTLTATEEYDGSTWSSGGNMGTARGYLAGAGTQSAGLAFGGFDSSFQDTAATEEYDGTSWTSGGNLGTARRSLAGAGSQSAGLAFGGYDSSFQDTAATEEYDGTSWTSGSSLNAARSSLAGAGSQTAGLAFGGYDSSFQDTAATEEYDGTSWTSGGSLAIARRVLAGAGTQTAGLGFGGYSDSGITAATEEYDGTSWTSGSSLNAARSSLAGAGSQTAGLAFGGFASSATTATEEYNSSSTETTVTTIPPLTTGEAGLIRYNQDVGSFEGHNGVEWGAIGGGGSTLTAGAGIDITDDVISATAPPLTYSTGTATGDGTTTQFTVAAGRTVHDILVFVNGLCFTPTDDYTISGTTLTFTEAPSNLAEITFRYLPI